MNEPTNQELKELMLSLFNQLDRKIEALDKKVEVQTAELKGEIKALEQRVMGEIHSLEQKMAGQMSALEERLMGEIKRLDERLAGIDKRVANEELISRGAFGAIIAGVIVALVKYLFSPDGF